MNYFKRPYGLILIILLSFWAIKPFFIQGFFSMHDDTQVARVFEMAKVLHSGVFPVRVVPDLGYGYGYPIFNFYAPLAYYVGAGFALLGFDVLVATKIMMVLGVILAGIFMYLLAKNFFNELGGIISGLFYVYAPYHAVDIYVRGDVAEFWAYAFIPLAFLGVYKKNILLGTVGFAALILSHNLTALMVVPFLLTLLLIEVYFSIKDKNKSAIYRLMLIIFLGLAISAFYWMPALLEMKNTNVLSQIGGGANFRDNFVCVGQLWDSPWGFGGSVSGCTDGLSFKIGKLHLLVSFVALVFMFCVEKARKSKEKVVVFFSFLGLIFSIFLTLKISKPIWEVIPMMDFFQYPWRFLILISFFSSLLAGSLIFILKQFKAVSLIMSMLFVFLLIFFNSKLFVPQAMFQKTVKDYTNELTLKWTTSRISDEYLPSNFKKPKDAQGINRSLVNIRVKETSVEEISNIISLVGLLALVLGIILFRRRQKI